MLMSLFRPRLPQLAVLGLLLATALPANGQDRLRALFERTRSRLAPAVAPAAEPAILKAAAEPTDTLPVVPTELSPQQLADEQAIREADAAFETAFGNADAAAVAAHFSADAEYVDEQGEVFQGRAAIEASLAAFFADNPGAQLAINVDSLRFVSPGVAIEDGTTTITRMDDAAPIETSYTTVHVKTDGKWLAVSVRDYAPKGLRQHRAQLEQLSWLVGDWVDEGSDAVVAFSCEPADGGNFLMRKFAVQIAGQEALSGTQRIGWDPLTGKLRTWIFDSEGGYGEGLWHRNGADWVLKLSGVSADGEPASSTSIYTLKNSHTMQWQTVDHEVGGVQLPDSEVITVVRKAPAPELTDAP